MTQNDGNGILDKIGSLFGGNKTTHSGTTGTAAHNSEDLLSGLGSMLSGSDVQSKITSLLGSVQSFDPHQIQTVLSALGKSSDPQVQNAKQDLQASQHDGETFVTKLKGYVSSLSQMLPTLLPALQSILAGKTGTTK